METLDRIAIEADCEKLMNQFAWHTDTLAYDDAMALFVPDCTFSRADEVFTGLDGLSRALERRPKDRRTCHIVSGVVVDVLDETTAEGKAHSLVFGHRGPLGENDEAPLVSPDSIVRYEVRFTRTEAGWRIARWHIGLNFRKAAG